MTNLICYTFGHSLKHKYSNTEPKYIKLIYCSRRNCNYELELS